MGGRAGIVEEGEMAAAQMAEARTRIEMIPDLLRRDGMMMMDVLLFG
jgi:hypothetical protein